MNILEELGPLYTALSNWCNFLKENGNSNFSEIFKSSFLNLQEQFSGDNKKRYNALLNFQDTFSGGMGSINDISNNDSLLRQEVEKEKDRLIDKYYDIVFSKN